MKLKKLLMIPIVGILLLGSVHTSFAEETTTAEIPVSVEIKEQAALPKAETFTITLTPQGEAPMPANSQNEAKLTFTAPGKQTFPKIEYTEPGDYRYTLKQELKEGSLCWIDQTQYDILVRVFVNEKEGDDYGKLEVYFTGATDENTKVDEFKFINSVYEPCIIDPPVRKIVLDENGNETSDTAGTFTFRMQPIGANAATAPMPNGTGTTMDLTLTGSTTYLREGDFGPLYQDSKGTIAEFGEIKYFEEGTWEYQISEVSASSGYTVDTEIYNLKMEVKRNDETHKYEATRTVTSKSQGVFDLAVFSFTDKVIPPETTTPETDPTPGGGGNGPGGGGRRSRPETSNNPPTTPTTPGEVLGATRDAAEDAGRGVLGAVRNPQGQVLGAVRTGDSSAMVTWAVILMLAASGIVGWFNMYQRRKRNI